MHVSPFNPLIERLRRIRLVADEAPNDGAYHVAPPADDAALQQLRSVWGGPLPPGLESLLTASGGIWGLGLSIDPLTYAEVLDDEGLGRMLRLSRTDNGDGWHLDASGWVWWIGREPWDLTLWERGLFAFVKRSVEWAESWQTWEQSGDGGDPPPELPVPVAEAPSRAVGQLQEVGPDLRAFLNELPEDAQVYDLRGRSPGVEIRRAPVMESLAVQGRTARISWLRHGAVVALVPVTIRGSADDPYTRKRPWWRFW